MTVTAMTNAGVTPRAPEQLSLDLIGITSVPPPAAVALDVAQARKRLAEFEAQRPPVATIPSLLAYDAVNRSLGLTDDMPTEAWMSTVASLVGQRPLPSAEVAAIRSCPAPVASRISAQLTGTGVARRDAIRVPDGDSDSDPAAIRAVLAERLHYLEDTCLDREVGGMVDQLDVASVVRCAALTDGAVRTTAMLEIVTFRRAAPGAPTLPLVAAWEGFDELAAAAGVDPMSDSRGMGRVLGRYARKEFELGHSDWLRRRVLGRAFAARNGADVYRTDHEEDGEAVLAAMIPAPILSVTDKMAVEKFRREHAQAGRRNRKLIARDLTRALDPTLAFGITHVRESRAMVEACREAEAMMRSDGLHGILEFGYDADGSAIGGFAANADQTIHMRAHWHCEFVALLDAGGMAQGEIPLARGMGTPVTRFNPATEPVVFEFVRADWAQPNDGAPIPTSVCPVPRIAHYSHTGVLLPAAGFSAEVIERRLDAILSEELPFPGAKPGGLMGPEDAARTRLHQRALSAGMILVAPETYLHGLLYALACALTITSSFARVGEVRQIVHDEAGWTVVGVGRFSADAFLAIPKGGAYPRRFALSPMAFQCLADLVELSLARSGMTEIASIAPSRDLSRKCREGRYVFAHAGTMLGVAEMNYLLAFLFGGVARVRSHDLRHAAAVRARKEGVTARTIAGWMNVAGGCVDHYSEDPYDDGHDDDEKGEADLILDQIDWFEARTDNLAIVGVQEAIAA